MNLANDTNKFRSGTFAFHSLRAALPLVQNLPQLCFVTLLVRTVGFRHNFIAPNSLLLICGQVWMDTLGNFTVQFFEAVRRCKVRVACLVPRHQQLQRTLELWRALPLLVATH